MFPDVGTAQFRASSSVKKKPCGPRRLLSSWRAAPGERGLDTQCSLLEARRISPLLQRSASTWRSSPSKVRASVSPMADRAKLRCECRHSRYCSTAGSQTSGPNRREPTSVKSSRSRSSLSRSTSCHTTAEWRINTGRMRAVTAGGPSQSRPRMATTPLRHDVGETRENDLPTHPVEALLGRNQRIRCDKGRVFDRADNPTDIRSSATRKLSGALDHAG
jgi:hypothetical protein